jgi:NADPH:quinone reductase-like Zn-dependent oxidoreductase
MATATFPSKMRAWKYASAAGGLEKNLTLHTSEALPKPGPDQHLIKVLAVGLNPVDFKPAEAPFVGRFAVKKPATPGFDVAGRIVTPADGSSLEPGQLVFGAASTNPLAGGGLAEYVAAPAKTLVPVPTGVSPLVVAGAPVAAVTAHGSIVPYVHAGSRLFINGGSGGVGTYGIQIAKAMGAHVTVSCSTKNVDLCRSLGADEVLDYTQSPLLEQLESVARKVRPFDHIVDNVFNDPALYFQAHTYSSASAKFVEVASGPTLGFLRFALGALLWPSWIGGGRRKFVLGYADIKSEHLEQIGKWIAGGEVKPVTDQVFAMEEAVEAFRRLKTGRARGKVIVKLEEFGK